MNKLLVLALGLVASSCSGMKWQTTDGSNDFQPSEGVLERLESSPKRGADEDISVSLVQTYCDDGLDQAHLFASLRNHFDQDPTVEPADQKSVDHETEKTKISRMMKPEYDTDLVVKTTATFEKKVGITADGKLGSGAVLVFKAEVTSLYDGLQYDIEHSCNPFRNEQGLKEFCDMVLAEINGPIRQTLPADPHYVMTGQETPEWAKKLGKFVK